MIIEVTYPYTVEFTRKNHRKSETRHMIGTVPTLVREVTSEDAPVAVTLSWKAAIGYLGNENPLLEGREHTDRVEIRKFEGKFWQPVILQHYDGKNRTHHAANPEEMERRVTYSSDWRVREGHPDFGDIKVRSIESNDEAEHRARHASVGDAYLLIDGIPFTTTTEPVYVLEESSGFSRDHHVWISTKFLTEGEGQTKTYRADRLDVVIAALEARRGAALDDDWLDNRQDKIIEVVDASLLDYRDEEVALLHIAELYLNGFKAEEVVERADMDFIRPFLALREAVKAGEVDGLTDRVADMITANSTAGLSNYYLREIVKGLRRYSALSEPEFDDDLTRALTTP